MAELAGYISSEVDRTNALISRFLDFAKPLELHPTVANLHELLDEVLIQVQPVAEKRGVRVEKQVSDNLTFLFDPELLRLALLRSDFKMQCRPRSPQRIFAWRPRHWRNR